MPRPVHQQISKPKCYPELQVEKHVTRFSLGSPVWEWGRAEAGCACATARVPLISPPLSPRASVLLKGGAHRPSSSAAGGEARDSAQSVSFPSLLGGVVLVVRRVSDGPTPELNLAGADDSAERAERVGLGREQQLQQGRGGQGCREWGGGWGRGSLVVRTRTLTVEVMLWQRRTSSPLSFPVPNLSQGANTADITTCPAHSGPLLGPFNLSLHDSSCHREVERRN